MAGCAQQTSEFTSLDLSSPLLSDKMRDAVQYSVNHEKELCRFLEDGRIPIDNGYCENAIRLYAQGRRNWLFCNTPSGAEAKMIIYSLVETARRNKANPLIYLTYLLEKTPEYMDLPLRDPRMNELMPWSEVYKEFEKRDGKQWIESIHLEKGVPQENIIYIEGVRYEQYAGIYGDCGKSHPENL